MAGKRTSVLFQVAGRRSQVAGQYRLRNPLRGCAATCDLRPFGREGDVVQCFDTVTVTISSCSSVPLVKRMRNWYVPAAVERLVET